MLETDIFTPQREAYLQELETNIKNKGYELAKLTVKVEESVSDFNVELEKIKDNCKAWQTYTFSYGAKYTKIGERGNDSFLNNMTKAGNILFYYNDLINPIMEWLNTLEENPDLRIEDVRTNYRRRIVPIKNKAESVVDKVNFAIRNRQSGSR